ncbi:MAG: glycosyltransferase [Lacibacter sp.]
MRLVVHSDFLHTPCFPYEAEAWVELLQQVTAGHPTLAEVLLLQKQPPLVQGGTSVRYEPVKRPGANPLMWRLFYNWQLASVVRRSRPDVFLSLSATPLPLKGITQWLFLPDGTCSSGCIQHYLQRALRHSGVNNLHLLSAAPSVAEASGIQTLLPYVPAIFRPVSAAEKDAVKERYTGGFEYFLYLGPICTQANLMNLLRAFSQFKKWQASSFKLVVCGANLWQKNGFHALLATYKHRHDVVVTGAVELAEAALLTASAYALVQPFAGNGYATSALAAMQAGVPAIVLRTPAHEAVGGAAFLYAENESAQELGAKMMLLYKDETLRTQLIRNGQQLKQQIRDAAIAQFLALLQHHT